MLLAEKESFFLSKAEKGKLGVMNPQRGKMYGSMHLVMFVLHQS
jgi:hypothetical protein